MFVAVYAIAKNESKFVDRFMDSASEADYVCVLDTGSTDDTVERLRRRGATVATRVIEPWRFDVARNYSLALVPPDADILICLDLDEIISAGWRDRIIATWEPGATRGRYLYVWNHGADGTDGVMFFADKIHTPGYHWENPVHEVLAADACEKYVDLPIRIDHWADNAKPRSSYLPLLELAVSERPENDRNVHYLGREYMYHGKFAQAIDTLKRHITMPTATWDAERAASMRYIARCYKTLGDADNAELWYVRAIIEAPQYREAIYELTVLMYEKEAWKACIFYGERALRIKQRPLTYISDPEAYGNRLDDMLAIAYWQTGKTQIALDHAKAALAVEPGNERLRNNVKLLER